MCISDEANITVSGSGFGSAQGAGFVMVGAEMAAVLSYADNQMEVCI